MNQATYAPIVLFVYNRPWHAKQTLNALMQNDLADQSVLYIYADGPKEDVTEEQRGKIQEVRHLLRSKQWCGEVNIIETEKNKGLADSIIDGVTEVVNNYGKIIVLEDDLITSKGFLKYMNEALDLYRSDSRVMHVSGFTPRTSGANGLRKTFFLRFMSCWGWATWERAWKNLNTDEKRLRYEILARSDFTAFNLENSVNIFDQLEKNISGEIKTWAVKWYSTIFLNNGLCLYPKFSLVQPIGLDGSGENCASVSDGLYDVHLADRIQIRKIKIKESKKGKNYLRRFYLYGPKSSSLKRLRIFLKIRARTKSLVEKFKV